MLSHEHIRDIELEEHVRYLVRRDLEAVSNRAEKRSVRLWRILNSNVGMFVLSSVLVAGLANYLGSLQAAAARQRDDRVQATRILAELDYRLIQIDFWVSRLPIDENTDPEIYIWRIIIGDTAYRATLPEFKESHVYGLVHRLDLLTGVSGAADARAAAIQLENIGRRSVPKWTYKREQVLPTVNRIKAYRTRVGKFLAER